VLGAHFREFWIESKTDINILGSRQTTEAVDAFFVTCFTLKKVKAKNLFFKSNEI